MSRAVGYLRVSPTDSENETIDQQRTILDRWEAQSGRRLRDRFEDEFVSGAVPMERRKDGRRLLAAVDAGEVDLVVVTALDRIGRDQLASLQFAKVLRDRNVGLISASEPFETDTPVGRFMLGLMLGKAELERADIARRTSGGKLACVVDGRYQGGRWAPLGYRVEDRRLVVDEATAPVVRRIFREVAAGVGCRTLAARLSAEGVPSPGGGAWNSATVRNIVRRSLYRGHDTWGPAKVPCVAPAIVSEDLWQAANAVADRRANHGVQRLYPYLLPGVLACGTCQGPMRGSTTGRQGKVWPYYSCDTPGCRSLRAEPADEAVWLLAESYVRAPDLLLGKLTSGRDAETIDRDELEGAKRELLARDAEEDRFTSAFGKGILSESKFEAQLQRLATERSALTARVSSLEAATLAAGEAAAKLRSVGSLLRGLGESLESARIEAKRAALRLLGCRVIATWPHGELNLEVGWAPLSAGIDRMEDKPPHSPPRTSTA